MSIVPPNWLVGQSKLWHTTKNISECHLRLHLREGRAADAIPSLRRAAREDPRSPLPPFHLGEALWQLGLRDEAVDAWRRDASRRSRLFWLTGDPGVGKSAFAAQLALAHSDVVVAAQFVEWDKLDHRNAKNVIQSLAFQLATRLPDYRKLLLMLPEIADLDRKDSHELFDYLLANPLRLTIAGGRQRYLIVIDAVDEASEAGRNHRGQGNGTD